MGRPQPSAPLGPLPFRESVIGRNGFRSPALSRHSLAPQANYADNGLSTPPAGAVALSGVRAARGAPGSPAVARTGKFCERNQADLPGPVSCAKIFRWRRRANQGHWFARPFPHGGRWPTSSTREGMRWTRRRCWTHSADADGEIAWF
jgi:hypothetical protein